MQLTKEEIASLALERWKGTPDRILDRMKYQDLPAADLTMISDLRMIVWCFTPDFGKWLTNQPEIMAAFRAAPNQEKATCA